MNVKSSRTWKWLWSALFVGSIVAVLVGLLGSGAMGALAQDGPTVETTGEAPEVDPPPVELSRVASADGTTNVTVELPITSDTYISSNQPNSNFGSSTWLRLGYDADTGLGAVRVLLKADLGRIPRDADINRARFRIYQHTVTLGSTDPKGFTSRHLNSDWNEYSVTWNSHQPDWGGIIATSEPSTSVGWIELDVTELIREIHSADHPDYGVTLLANETPTERERIFYSREQGGGLYPRIIVEYVERVDTEAPRISVEPLPQWSQSRFTVKWSGDDPGGSGIDHYDIQYRVAPDPWSYWLENTTATSAEWSGGANGTLYEFRARGVDKAGNIQVWSATAQASTRVDTIPPAASVNPLPPVTYATSFIFTWSGTDNAGGSGLKYYDVQYRLNGGPWEDLFLETIATAAQMTGGTQNASWEFRVRGVDVAGNVQAYPPVAQAATIVDVEPPKASVVPFVPPITAAASFTVGWSGQSSPNTTIVSYDVQTKFGTGAWSEWLTGTTLTQSIFTNVGATDGVYCFRVRARDNAGRVSAYSAEQCIAVDRFAPFVEPKRYLPVVGKRN